MAAFVLLISSLIKFLWEIRLFPCLRKECMDLILVYKTRRNVLCYAN